MLVRLLGSVDVVIDGAVQAVPGRRSKAVLAALALRPGEVVGAEHMRGIIWGDATATPMSLQSHISRLRRIMGRHAAIVARSSGYVLEVDGEATDVQAVERLLRQADRCADPHQRQQLLQDAVALGRGRALAELGQLDWFDRHAERLEQLLLNGRLALVDARLALGEHLLLVPELTELTERFPLDEQIHRRLMLALYRAGKQSDAVASYQRLCRVLDDELGLGPIEPLRELYTAILRQDPGLSVTAPPAEAPARPRPVPAQLPMPVREFGSRAKELDILDGLVATSAVVATISGMAGVGKTALAVHWAHRAIARFPDGQLYVNLHGFDPAAAPTPPARALHGFLEALGVPAARLPSEPDSLVSLYRTMVAGRRMLVVLDNARDAEQARPLLPGSPGCLAIVTSRDQLVPLIVTQSAQPVNLDLLSSGEARDLLVRRLGAHRVAAEPAAADEIVDRCAGLPLALAIVAARAGANPHFSLASVAGELRSLDAFHAGDDVTDVRKVFSWSCRTLTAPAFRLFRLLSSHPGPDVSVPAAASLARLPRDEAGALLTELSRASLLTEHEYGRYAFHDLLRAYAAGLADEAEPPLDRRAAVRRLLDHYLHAAHAADLALHPHFSEISLPPPQEGATAEHPTDRSAATAWFTAELAVLLAAVPLAARSGLEGHAWRLAWTVAGFLHRHGNLRDWLDTQHIALAAASRIGDRTGQGHAHRSLGLACSRLHRHDEAGDHLRRALDLFAAEGDDAGRAHTYLNLGQLAERQGRHREALDHSRQALALFRQTGNRAGQGYTLNAVGWQEGLLGNYHRALDLCGQALQILQEVDDAQGQADTWDSLGYTHHRLGDDRRAVTCYGHALELFGQVNDRYAEAATYTNLGESHRALAEVGAARAAWCRALAILEELGDAGADDVRAELKQLDAARSDHD